MPKRVKIGDVVEIVTQRGFAYAHYSHKHPRFGALLRVFRGIHSVRPTNLAAIILEEPQFLVFFPLGAAVNRQIVFVVGNLPLPQHAQLFPMFRSGIADPVTKKVNVWWLWDGKKEWRVGTLTAAQQKLSMRHIVNDTELIDRIVRGYNPENVGF